MATTTVIRLHPYQEAAVASATEARGRGQTAALWVMPTGTGKTICFGELVRRWNVKTLILAHREELLVQAKAKLAALGIPETSIGIVGAGYEETGRQITIGSVQSLSRPKRLQSLASSGIQLVIVDECHHRTAPTYCKILDAVAPAFELGVSATPDRADGGDVSKIYGKPVCTVRLPEMIRDGYLCDLKGIQVKTPVSLDGVHTRMGDFAEGELSAAINRPDRNQVIVDAYERNASGRPTLTFCAGVRHAHDLADLFTQCGIAAEALDGTTPQDTRHAILHRYATGQTHVLCNCAVLTEGFDAPATSCVILARPTQSRSLYAQMVGRGTRTAPGKSDCLVLDIADNTSKHSLTVLSLPHLVGRKGYAMPPADYEEREAPEPPFSLREAIEGPIVDRKVNLLGNATTWQSAHDGNYWYALDSGEVFWLVLRDTGYVASVVWRDSHRQELTAQPLTLDWAQTIAEQAIIKCQDGQTHLIDNRAAWRGNEASEKQLWLMRKLHIRIPPNCTKGQASDLISAAQSKQYAAS